MSQTGGAGPPPLHTHTPASVAGPHLWQLQAETFLSPACCKKDQSPGHMPYAGVIAILSAASMPLAATAAVQARASASRALIGSRPLLALSHICCSSPCLVTKKSSVRFPCFEVHLQPQRRWFGGQGPGAVRSGLGQ